MLQNAQPVFDTTPDEIDRLTEAKRRIYDEEAERYDEKRFRSGAGLFYEDLANAQIHALLGDAKNGRVLDVATGTGRVALGLGKRGVNVVGVDISDGMLQRARDKAARDGIVGASFQRGNASALPFDDDTFDAVVSVRFLHIMEARQQAPFVAEMVRVLKPGGMLLVELNNALPHFFGNAFGSDPNVSIWPWKIRSAFEWVAPVDVVDMVGVGLPGLGRASRYSAHVCRTIGLALQRGPTAFLGRQVIIKAIKRAG